MASTKTDAAVEILRRVPLIDGHNDLPWALREIAGEKVSGRTAEVGGVLDLTVEQQQLHTDLVRLRRGGVGAQFWSVYVPCRLSGADATVAVLEQIELVYELANRYSEDLTIARTADEARAAFDTGKIGSMLGAEGGHCIADSLGVLRALHRLGVRYMTLTHNENTAWADSATDEPVHGGLTDFGRDVVREMNRLGMLVDLSHVAATTMNDALDTSTAPVIFSHSSCRAVADHPRNVPDEVLARLAGNGGVCMVTFVPAFVSPAHVEWGWRLREAMAEAGENYLDLTTRERFFDNWDGRHDSPPPATVEDVVKHVEHAREVAGVDHIGIGGDYDGCPRLPDGLTDVSGYPELFGALLERGWSEEDLAKLAGGNVLRAWSDAERVSG
ncbi:membrane dipeptidase [Herbihabitans rhizosphaerae]|uniref:Membrane dipeptidase n=1 Tax=Herbihabitans rhizosphaerae TaxID=1872711 RepID=A0A4Q7KGQ1_9PSEU|nr:dipeptidase [Herbihabitans rhizosphaerae]RZS34433.1 membrane dipeptidase [Herbihabitans rhizosphaerae]